MKMSYIKRKTKLKRTVSYSCVNPQLWYLFKVRCSSPRLRPIHSPSETLGIHSILHYSPCLPDIQTTFFKQSFTVSIHLFCGIPTDRLPAHSLSNPIILHSLHMVEPLDKTFINPFVYPLRHSAQLPYPSILYSHNPISLLFIP